MPSSSNKINFCLRQNQTHLFWTHQRLSDTETPKPIRVVVGSAGNSAQELPHGGLLRRMRFARKKVKSEKELMSTLPAQSVLKANARRGEWKTILALSCETYGSFTCMFDSQVGWILFLIFFAFQTSFTVGINIWDELNLSLPVV